MQGATRKTCNGGAKIFRLTNIFRGGRIISSINEINNNYKILGGKIFWGEWGDALNTL